MKKTVIMCCHDTHHTLTMNNLNLLVVSFAAHYSNIHIQKLSHSKCVIQLATLDMAARPHNTIELWNLTTKTAPDLYSSE